MKEPSAERLPRLRAFWHSLRLDQRGTALVEFALIAPVLFLLIFGVVDFGRALNYYNQESQLAGQGARAAGVDRLPDDSAQATGTLIQQQLRQTYAKGELHNNMQACITFPDGTGVGKPVTVTNTYTFHFLPLIGAALGLGGAATIDISASQTERQEATPTYSAGCDP